MEEDKTDVRISPEKCLTCIFSRPPRYEKAKCGNQDVITYLKEGQGWWCKSYIPRE